MENIPNNKARKVHSIRDLRKEISLKIRLYVLNDMMVLSYLVDIGAIPDGGWTNEKEEKYGKSLYEFANKLAEAQIEEMKEWEKDGRPE